MATTQHPHTASGDVQSRLAGWFREFRGPLRRFIARRRGLSPGDLDDVAQEVFLRLLRYGREDLVADPKRYLFKIAANVTAEWSMRARQRLPHASCWLDDIADGADVIDDTERAMRDAKLHAALGELPPRSREVLRLRFGEGLAHEAISKRLNVTQRIVKREIVNAYARLRVTLSNGADQSATPDRLPLATLGNEP